MQNHHIAITVDANQEKIAENVHQVLGADFDPGKLAALLEKMDRNHDGVVDFKEFQTGLIWSSVLEPKKGVYGVLNSALSSTCHSDEPLQIPAWKTLSAGFLSGAVSRTCNSTYGEDINVMRANTSGPQGMIGTVKSMAERGGSATSDIKLRRT